MEKLKFICKICEKKYLKWTGFCFSCNNSSSIEEINETIKIKKNFKNPIFLEDIKKNTNSERVKTNIHEFDRVLGNGIIPNSVILLTGIPGIGKSTILLQIAEILSKNLKILYVATEESIEQIKTRAERLNLLEKNKISFIHETDLESIISTIDSFKPNFVILDSLQNCYFQNEILSNNINGLRNSAQFLVNHCKENLNYSLIVTGHVTKDGNIAGPKSLEHVVDVVLYFEGNSESSLRVLRSTKNRFGSTEEIGFFLMTEKGIISCKNPQNFLIEQKEPTIGSSFTWLKEGSRSFIIEIQALINPSKMNNPQRIITGIEQKQLILTCAILEKYLKIPLYQNDIFCKVVGNIPLKGLYSDVSLAIALISSYLNKPLKENIIFGGEIGLSGNIFLRENIFIENLFNQFKVEKIALPKTEDFEKKNYIELKNVYQLLKFFN